MQATARMASVMSATPAARRCVIRCVRPSNCPVNSTGKSILGYALVLLLPFYWIASEVFYARGKQPSGLTTVADYYERFGAPTAIAQIDRDGTTFYHLSGHLPRWPWAWAFPSNPPAYVFDSSGQFVEWSSDPGDDPHYQQRWPSRTKRPVDPADFKTRYAP